MALLFRKFSRHAERIYAGCLARKKERLEADELRAGLLEGHQDAIAGRTTTFSGNLKADMAQFKKRGHKDL